MGPLRRGGVSDDIRIPPLGDTAGRAHVDHPYGYLAVRCLATRYGERRMMIFVNAVVRQQKSIDTAARQAFGKSFATVNDAYTTYFRTTVG